MRKLRTNWKLFAALCFAIGLLAQDAATLATPDVARVGDRLACRCGGCRNTVGNCPMIHCGSADPMRKLIYNLKQAGKSDDQIISSIVQEQGIVALASPPSQGWGLFTWVMPGIALAIGFLVYSWYIRNNRKTPQPVTANDQAVLDRFQSQIDSELDPEDTAPSYKKDGVDSRR